MELTDKRDVDLLGKIHADVLTALERGESLAEPHRLIYEVEDLILESNSGASFEQYFRWARVEQIAHIVDRLREIGAVEASKVTHRAIEVAFPNGPPESESEKSDLTNWTEKQEVELQELFYNLNPTAVQSKTRSLTTRGNLGFNRLSYCYVGFLKLKFRSQ